MLDFPDRGQFLNLAALFEGGLVAVAFAIGWIVGINPLADLTWSWSAVAWGTAGALPLFLGFLLLQQFPLGPFRGIERFLVEMLGPYLAACRWYDLILLAVLAGFCEEVLFRGLLQPWFEPWGWIPALIASNVLFGLAHLVTPLYALLAGVTGVYLGLLLDAPLLVSGQGERNLLIPIVTHTVYDYLGFMVVARTYRQEQSRQ